MTENYRAPEVGSEEDSVVVSTDRGAVRGIRRPSSTAFLGIPFAAPPVGENRLVPPVLHPTWEGVRPTREYGPTPQRRPFGSLSTIPEPSIAGESTLNVNVFTPAPGDRQARLPVLVWIHGGGYFAGSPASPWYDGRSFNRDGVVTVTLSYRLGFDGWGWVDGGGLNRGLLDQIAALEWVQRNIHQFGGDPGKVTVGGQSAGGSGVQYLLTSPRAQGLFRAAISHSAAAGTVHADRARPVAEEFAASLRISPTLEGWRTVTEGDILDHERAYNSVGAGSILDGQDGQLDISNLLAKARDGRAGNTGFAWTPIIDGDVLPSSVEEAIADGAGAHVPVLNGTTRNEFAFPSDDKVADLSEQLRKAGICPAALRGWADEVQAIGDRFARSQLITAARFRTAAARFNALRAAAGAGQTTWAYDFAGRSAQDGVSAHCYDLPFAWDLLNAPGVAAVLGQSPSQRLAHHMHADWVTFISEGHLPWIPVAESVAGARRYVDDGVIDDPGSYAFEAELGGVGHRTF